MTSWVAQVKSLGVAEAARRLGLSLFDRRHLGPCPACSATSRSRSDSRPGPLFVVAERGWTCQQCGAKGDAVKLAAWVLLGAVPGKGDPRWKDLRKLAAERGLCQADWKQPWTPPPPRAAEPRRRIRPAELADLWDRSAPADEDPEVARWLTRRGLDPERCAELDLCRALPEEHLPRWAIFRGAPWSLGWRCLVRAWGPSGELASIRARWVKDDAPPDGGEKTGAAAGGPGSAGGAVLACAVGRQVLARGRAPSWWPADAPLGVVITEGEPDWLTWAARVAGEGAPAVLGLFSGAWSSELAERIPDGAEVSVRTHRDDAGNRYAKPVIRSLWWRCRVRSWAEVAHAA